MSNKHSVVEDGDTYTLGRFYAMWFPGASLMQVLSVASTLKYTGVQQLDPIEQALKFVKGYMHETGPFYEAPEQSNKLANGTMKRSDFMMLLDVSRKPDQKQAKILEIYHSLDRLESVVDTMATKNTTTANNTPVDDLDAIIAAKTAKQEQERPANQYEENTTGSVNHFEISGNLGRDTEVQALPSGQIVAKNGLGMFNPGTKGDKDHATKWWDLTMWLQKESTPKYPSNAELFKKFISMEKGTKVVVNGRVSFRYWQAKDGTQHETAVITVSDIDG
jgi:hypothetical protein